MSYSGWSQIWRFIVEVIFCIIIIGFILFALSSKIYHKTCALCIAIFAICIFGYIDCYKIRGKCKQFKKEKADNVKTDNIDDDYITLLNNYRKNTGVNYLLNVDNIKVNKLNMKNIKTLYDLVYPVGSIVIMKDDPSKIFGGQWALIERSPSDDEVKKKLKAKDYKLTFFRLSSDDDKAIGEYEVTLNSKEVPYHTHRFFTSQEINYHCAKNVKYCANILQDKKASKFSNDTYFTLEPAVEVTAHNNIPAFLPLNFWQRISLDDLDSSKTSSK
jgi:hypothetical protein